MNAFIYLIRRELWEHTALWLVPLILAGTLVLVAAVGSAVTFDQAMGVNIVSEIQGEPDLAKGLALATVAVAGIFGLVMSLVITFYLLDCLLADRKDRSILFWKSLPVSDLKTVLSKLVTAAAVAPLITYLASMIATVLLLVVFSVDLLILGENPWAVLWAPNPLFGSAILVLYGFVVEVLWYMPLIGYLLLISAFAKRAVLAWAVVPPLLISLMEQLTFGTRYFADLLAERFQGVLPLAMNDDMHERIVSANGEVHLSFASPGLDMMDPGAFLSHGGLWSGLVLAAVFVSGAVFLRRYRDESL